MNLFGVILLAQHEPIWQNPYNFGMAVLSSIVFGIIGIAMAYLGFKVFDKLTPGKLDEEILQKQNIAAAILAGAFLIGICIIIAAAIHG